MIQGELASEEDNYFVEWAEDSYKAVPGQLLDSLNKLITLTAALIGGSLLGLRDDLMPRSCRAMVIGCLILSMTFAFIGTLPRHNSVDFRDPIAIRMSKQLMIARRGYWLIVASLTLIGAFAVALLGLIIR